MTKMVCSRLEDGNIELKVSLTFTGLETKTLETINKMLRDIRPVPLSHGCERGGDSSTTDCIVVLHSHTSDPGIFEAITSFARIMSTVAPIDDIDACGLRKTQ